jgi:transposase
MSWIRRIKRGNQFYLYEVTTVWENGKSKQKLIQYLGVEGDQEKVPKPKTKRVRPDRIHPLQSRGAGDVLLLWKIAETLNCVNIIDRYTTGFENIQGPSPGKYLTTWAINRLIDPESATQLDAWVKSTILSDLTGMDPLDFSKDAYLQSLDAICSKSQKNQRIQSHIPFIEAELYQKWRTIHPLPDQSPETIAYDLTTIPTYGKECPLIEPGSKTHETQLNQLNLSVITSYFDSYPIAHFVHPGSFHSITTIPDLMIRLREMMVPQGTIVWDRGYTTTAEIGRVEKEGWKLVCGVTKRTKEAKNLIARTEPPIDPDHLVPTQCMNIYAEKVDTPLFGRKGSVVVYVNTERRMRERKSRNCAIYQISEEFRELEKSCSQLKKEEVMKKIGKFLPKSCTKFFNYSVQEGQTGSELTWSANTDARIEAERRDGKYLLYATDPSLSGSDVVMKYFERDFVEKVFRDLKLFEEIAPIRHRKESRILGIMVVCTLALRLKVALRTMLEGAKDKDLSGEQFLKQIGRVHQVDLQMDNDVQVWYVGLQKKLEKVLEEIGMKGLFGERVRYS